MRPATNPSPACRALIGLGFGYAAYLAEVYRSGIESIPKGQMEAARSLGMGYGQAMQHVILPQAIRRVVPPLSNDLVAMLKDSALVSVVAVPRSRKWRDSTFRAPFAPLKATTQQRFYTSC